MTLEITSLDAYFLVKEIKQLEGSRLDKIYQLDKKDFLFVLHKEGKHFLRTLLGKTFFLANNKPEVPQISSFCKHLRKLLGNIKIKKIFQLNFDRIIVLELENDLKLIMEFFGKGNLIITDKDNIIQTVLERQKWANREIKKDEEYIAGTEKITDPTDKSVLQALKKQENMEKFVASIGFGKKYAQEICNNTSSPEEVFKNINKIINSELQPRIYKSGKNIIVTPFEMTTIQGESLQFATLSEAHDHAFNTFYAETPENIAKQKYQKKKDRLLTIINAQEKQLRSISKISEENQNIGNKIYENYQEISELFELLTTKDFDNIVQQLKADKKLISASKKGDVEIEL